MLIFLFNSAVSLPESKAGGYHLSGKQFRLFHRVKLWVWTISCWS